MVKPIATKEFTTELVLERTCTPVLENLGVYNNTMDLYIHDGCKSGLIEWTYENEDDDGVEHIGLWFDGKTVTGYDGVFELPQEAIQLLEENGYDCTDVK